MAKMPLGIMRPTMRLAQLSPSQAPRASCSTSAHPVLVSLHPSRPAAGLAAAFAGGCALRQRRARAASAASDLDAAALPVASALSSVLGRINAAADGRSVQLVAVSKTRPASAVEEAFRAGQVLFGENYVQELLEKASLAPPEVRWHFIGKLQSNKVKKVLSVPNLKAIETVDSSSLADRLARVAKELGRGVEAPALDVYVQVDTSGEETKGGVDPEDAPALAAHIVKACSPALRLAGLMTIGAPGDFSCFDRLIEARRRTAELLGLGQEELALSMGMSGDYEEAIRAGATSVRVGSSIFGARPPK
mmetsp:Transcript_63426/g.138115  ORF Transcript_63426/g.138115 Transcript_63426/m.138115 type:complete len:306 (+) Transcript_63426:100-1017(+)